MRERYSFVTKTLKQSSVVPYSITSVGLRADPCFLAVSPQATSHLVIAPSMAAPMAIISKVVLQYHRKEPASKRVLRTTSP